MAEQFSPTVALVDIGLPVMDGYEVGQRLRAMLRDVHLVALTGYGRPSDYERSRGAGFADHAVKPVSSEQLEKLLAR
jgi:CheY-like chemotaxis protein